MNLWAIYCKYFPHKFGRAWASPKESAYKVKTCKRCGLVREVKARKKA